MATTSDRAEIERRSAVAIRRDLGEDIFRRLNDADVFEVILNSDGSLWEDRFGVGLTRIGTMTLEAATSFLRNVAAGLDLVINKDRPSLSCEIAIRKARLEASVWPLTPFPQFNIRLPAVKIFTFADYVADGIMTERQRAVIEDAIASNRNVMISGGTGSGKTTFANACLQFLALIQPRARLVIIEELREIQTSSENVAFLRTAPGFAHNDLVRICMRMRPDRIIIGEVRGPEALALLKAMNTGHDGTLFTIHANDVRAALVRFEDLIAEATQADKRRGIAEAVHIVVSIAKTPAGRRVQEIVKVEGFAGDYVLTTLET